MEFSLTTPNPDIVIEKRIYETEYKGKKKINGLIFFNNFFHKYFPDPDPYYGREAYLAGAGEHKQNTFRDFFDESYIKKGLIYQCRQPTTYCQEKFRVNLNKKIFNIKFYF